MKREKVRQERTRGLVTANSSLCVPQILVRLSDDHELKSMVAMSTMKKCSMCSETTPGGEVDEGINGAEDADDLENLAPNYTVLQLCLLQTCSVYLLSNHILSVQDFKATLSQKVQTRVLEVSILCVCSVSASTVRPNTLQVS